MASLAPESGGYASRDEVVSRRITTEEMVRQQIMEITRIRNDVGDPMRTTRWSEALEALVDSVMPWSSKDKEFQKEWDARKVSCVRGDDGELIPFPTAAECRIGQRIVMAMLDRAQLLVKRRVTSGPGPRSFADPAKTPPTAPEPEPSMVDA